METKKFYERCSRMLRDIKEKRTGIKTACYKTEMPKKYMAVLSSILRKYDTLLRVVNALPQEIRSKWHAVVICYEILYGNKRESTQFNKKLISQVKDTYNSLGIIERNTPKDTTPQYIRINTLKATETVISSLSTEVTCIPHVYKSLERVNWSKLVSFQQGLFFIQDLSSCMPAYVLNPPSNTVVLDACAAPGNKTTHLAMISPSSTVYAIEKDIDRYTILREMVEKSGAENIVTIHGDFLGISHGTLPGVEYILVDPSCSGSGMHPGEEKEMERLKGLCAFQVKALSMALGYPGVKRVVYSTCSIYEEENEAVVDEVLKAHPGFMVERALPEWPGRGVPGYAFSGDVVRCGQETETKGFFLASIVRRK
ncbi:25S rRNA (cytosine2278-C5)-methyltransferase [Nematocida ausubeli]|nr:25S rRNA (cytosine2278-C5)-methyltransferase [Nematocida ausubeli]